MSTILSYGKAKLDQIFAGINTAIGTAQSTADSANSAASSASSAASSATTTANAANTTANGAAATAGSKYTKPGSGIPLSDLAAAVQSVISGALTADAAAAAFLAKQQKADAASAGTAPASTVKPNLLDISAGNAVRNLPAANSVPAGTEAYFKVTAATDPANPTTSATIAPGTPSTGPTAGTADTINGAAISLTMRVKNRTKRIVSDGVSNWLVLGGDQDATVEEQRTDARYSDLSGRLPSTFSPVRDLPSVFGWYSAADAQTAVGATPANNASIIRVPDQSGLGNDLDQMVTSAARPTFIASATNGIPSIKFASGQYLRSLGDNFKQLARSQPLTYIALVKLTASTANFGSIVGTMGDTTGAYNTAGFTALAIHATANDAGLTAMAASNGAVGGDPVPDSLWHVAICVMQPSGQSITYLDGAIEMQLTGHGTNSASGPIQLSSAQYPIIGEIAEAGLVNAVLTDDQIWRVTDYFNTKAGLGL